MIIDLEYYRFQLVNILQSVEWKSSKMCSPTQPWESGYHSSVRKSGSSNQFKLIFNSSNQPHPDRLRSSATEARDRPRSLNSPGSFEIQFDRKSSRIPLAYSTLDLHSTEFLSTRNQSKIQGESLCRAQGAVTRIFESWQVSFKEKTRV